MKEKQNTDRNQQQTNIDVHGIIVDQDLKPLIGATVKVKGTSKNTATNNLGEYLLPDVANNAVLIVSYIGYLTQEVSVKNASKIILSKSESKLDEVQVIAYGTTTKRLNTGSVATVSAKDIEKQPVSNPLAILSGKVPGLLVTQSSGQTGASFTVQVRGQNSIVQNSDPLFIVDGVPFATNNDGISQVGGPFSYSLARGRSGDLSPFNSINPSDIESIEILKDADATAIYGSRGANGVVLITTKKGKAGKTKFDVSFQEGYSQAGRMIKMMSTDQYLAMRKEAFANDGVSMTNSNAFDVLLWDTKRSTDWGKYLLGGTANTKSIQGSVSGGNDLTQFLIGANYYHETTVSPGSLFFNRGGMHVNINHSSTDKRFSIQLTTSYTASKNNNSSGNLAGSMLTILPNTMPLYDSAGNLTWSESGFTFTNPLSFIKSYYNNTINSLNSNLQISYRLLSHLKLQLSSGYNLMEVDEIKANPIISKNPSSNPTGNAAFGNNSFKSLVIEPQLSYDQEITGGKLDVLLGTTYQQNNGTGSSINASGYTNDELIRSMSAAPTLSVSNSFNEYRYAAVFGRIHYNYKDTYLINITGRRDGSSRFGPGRQWANFGAIGAGWIFSNFPVLKNELKWLSFGKFRASYGITGNDGIGNYQYLDTYSNSQYPYDGKSGLYPTRLFNAEYGWESNKKLEAALELGFLRDRIFLSTAWYRNRSDNQLVNYALPTQTGFASITQNLPALVQNTGVEFLLNTRNITTGVFKWTTDVNVSFPQNKLLKFPGLSTSSYRNTYAIGKSLNIGSGYITAGVNPKTGVYDFVDQSGNISSTPSYRVVGLVNLDPKYYGGITNDLTYRQWSLSFFFEFRKQMGYSLLQGQRVVPGQRVNQPVEMLDVWHKPGDVAQYQRYTQSTTSDAYKANAAIYSDGADVNYADASFIRLRNIYIGYQFSDSILKKLKVNRLNLFLQGQNLWLITKYKGNDPEIQLNSIMAPLKSFVLGIQLSM
ncbi:MAG: hypothetical protein BGO42_04730 [Flavobacterium sp. 40-81]|nr:MAG: hypothetical protein BGO42_04730 [Flavobacterium sp. 40-81]